VINSRLKLSVENDSEVFEMEVETLANETIKAVGHKQYKAHVKTHRTFLRYLKNLPDIYTVSHWTPQPLTALFMLMEVTL
jgi:hypothetical protein